MLYEDRYFVVSLESIEAVVKLEDFNKVFKVLNCSNYEFCHYANHLIYGACPNYCPVIIEFKKYLFRKRKPKAVFHEIKKTTDLKEKMPLGECSFR